MDFFSDLPAPVKGLLAALTGTGILGSLYYVSPGLAGIIAAGAILLAMMITAFYVIKGWLDKRRGNRSVEDLKQQSTATPAAIRGAERHAELEAIRQKFAEGLSKFNSAENVGALPWYVIVGESGGGKTEAIRHCGVGFPPGLQDEFQGVGGTINMNWWFTNQAVFLDTAGRIMFEEVKTGETSEWKEFLQLLLRNRPTAPINGLILVIPADSIIKDTEQKLHEKAGRIAQQLDLIQRTLDVRFPVFIVVSKCDLLSGFREFFDDLTDAQSQQQMLGWSNPLDRDEPFQPPLVTDHIDTVVERIKKRRLSLLLDPRPQKGMERRVDEVDALFAFPQSLQLISPRLRMYLEKIFVAGPWSPKPLFLRGIYFASSMQEGAALDQELAEALGIAPDELHEEASDLAAGRPREEMLGLAPDELQEHRRWRRERAFFLRDLFTEKIFKERGLVTRATNTRKLLRRRSLVVWCSGTALALVFAGFNYFGYVELEKSIAARAAYWLAASDHKRDRQPEHSWVGSGIWRPIVKPKNVGDIVAVYHGEDIVPDLKVSLVNYHEQLRRLANEDPATSWVYKPLEFLAQIKGDQREAQRIVFEAGVLNPALQAARRRMEGESPDPTENAPAAAGTLLDLLGSEAEALSALIRVESDAIAKEPNVSTVSAGIIFPLVRYATKSKPGTDPISDTSRATLDGTLTQIYGDSRNRAPWKPNWLAVGSGALTDNPPIKKGLERLRNIADKTAITHVESLDRLKELRNDLREFREIEKSLDKTVPLAELPADEKGRRMDDMDELLGKLRTKKLNIDSKVEAAKRQNVLDGQNVSILAAYERIKGEGGKSVEDSFKKVKDAVKADSSDTSHKLFGQVDEDLEKTRKGIEEKIAEKFPPADLAELADLDAYLSLYDAGRRIYEVRADQYTAAQRELLTKDRDEKLIGRGWEPLNEVRKSIEAKRAQFVAVEEKLLPKRAPLARTCGYYLDRARDLRIDKITAAYVDQTREQFKKLFFEPMVSGDGGSTMSPKEMAAAKEMLAQWASDLDPTSNLYQSIPSPRRAALGRFSSAIKEIPAKLAIRLEADKKYKEEKAAYEAVVAKTFAEVTIPTYREGGWMSKWRYLVMKGEQNAVQIDQVTPPPKKIEYNGTWEGTFYTYDPRSLPLDGTNEKSPAQVSFSDLVEGARRGGRVFVNLNGKDRIELRVSYTPPSVPPPRDPSTSPGPSKRDILRTLDSR